MKELRYYQEEAIAAVNNHLASKDTNPCVVLPTGCHALGHPILMYDGSVKNIEDVRVGDAVMGDDSTPRHVLSLCRGRDEMFEVTPVRGDSFIVNGDHVLSLERTRESNVKKYPCVSAGGEIDNLTVREYILKSKSWKHLRKLYSKPVDFTKRNNLPLDPYLLGLLIGDGSMKYNVLGFCTADDELVDEVMRRVRTYGCIVKSRSASTYRNRSESVWELSIVASERGRNPISEILRGLGLMGCGSEEKFIPFNYLTATREERLEIMAGLIDTDGYVDGGIDYISASRGLADDLAYLARSLGFHVKRTAKVCSCQTGAVGLYYRLSISGDLSTIPLRRKRHINKIHQRRQKKNVLRTGFSVRKIGVGNYYGFVLDGNHLYLDGRFMVHHNSGKSLVIAEMVRRWKEAYPPFRAIVLAHRKELVDQNAAELLEEDASADVGIFAAGLKRRDTEHTLTFASIDSVYNKANRFAPFDCILVDEAHRIPIKGEGKYRRFIRESKSLNPRLRVVGLTATPFRLDAGPICDKHFILNEIVYEADLLELMDRGYLCRLRSKIGQDAPDLRGIHKVQGDFDKKELAVRVNEKGLVAKTVTSALEVMDREQRKCCIWFCVDVEHCEKVAAEIAARGETVAFVTGTTSAADRARMTEDFRAGKIRHLLNVNVFTEGFNVKQVDAIALLRPTLSKGMYWQMVGRGLRIHPDKTDCIVLDFAHLIDEHGPLTEKEGSTVEHVNCAQCNEYFPRRLGVCPCCGWEIPKAEPKERPPEPQGAYARRMHEEKYGSQDILGRLPTCYKVDAVYVARHVKTGAPPSLRVTYRCGINVYPEWVCLEHPGYARTKAIEWWRAIIGQNVPLTVDEALANPYLNDIIKMRINTIEVRKEGKYFTITKHNINKETE